MKKFKRVESVEFPEIDIVLSISRITPERKEAISEALDRVEALADAKPSYEWMTREDYSKEARIELRKAIDAMPDEPERFTKIHKP
jgi:hypothetical protein